MSPLWLILDVETTGLDPATAGVWQLGAVLLSVPYITGKSKHSQRPGVTLILHQTPGAFLLG